MSTDNQPTPDEALTDIAGGIASPDSCAAAHARPKVANPLTPLIPDEPEPKSSKAYFSIPPMKMQYE